MITNVSLKNFKFDTIIVTKTIVLLKILWTRLMNKKWIYEKCPSEKYEKILITYIYLNSYFTKINFTELNHTNFFVSIFLILSSR